MHCRPESQRAGGLILFDKQPLSALYLEGERGKNQQGWAQNLSQRPSKSRFLPSLPPSRSLAVIILFALSLLPSKERCRGKRGGGIVYLTLICSVVSFGEMTCNLGGKGQLFLFPLFWEPIYSPRGLLFSTETCKLFQVCHIVSGSLIWRRLKEETPSRSFPWVFPWLIKFHSYLFKCFIFVDYFISSLKFIISCCDACYKRLAITVIEWGKHL